MIRKNKNKLRSKTKSKILVLGLILIIVLVGLLSPVGKAEAAPSAIDTATNNATTSATQDTGGFGGPTTAASISADATAASSTAAGKAALTAATPDPKKSAFEDEISKNECSINPASSGTFYPGCFIQLFYGLFYVIPSWFLYVSAYFFNVLISITLGTALFKLPFVGQAWGVVRDVSNIFFILILLYIAIKVILGLGGTDVKKMIAKVVIIALLINFSMFFTQVIIDASNILALIFYNKVSVSTTDAQGNETPYQKTGNGEKDVAGGLVNAFNPTKLLSEEYLNNAKTTKVETHWYKGDTTTNNVAPGILIGMTLIAGILMFFAAYCLVIVGLSFLGRLIELFILIIFSPFAFMSSTIPLLSSVEDLGWDAWFKRLLKAAFMAPIFMFFLYFIFMLVKADIFSGLKTASSASMIESLLMIVLPALLILVLLLKATEFAKKGSGAVGEMVMKGAKMAGGFALGAAAGTAAVASRATVGRAGGAMANSQWAKKWESHGWGGESFRKATTAMGAGSFDARGIKIAGKDLASATGMSMGKAQEGGFAKRRKEQVEGRQKRAKELEVGEDEPLKQALNKTEIDLQGLLSENAQVIETLDKDIEKKRQEVGDAEKKLNAARDTAGEGAARTVLTNANRNLDMSKENKKDFREGREYMMTNSAGVDTLETGTGKNISELEEKKKAAAQAIKTENVGRRQTYANTVQSKLGQTKDFIFSGGQHSFGGSREAAHKIRTEEKLDSGTKT